MVERSTCLWSSLYLSQIIKAILLLSGQDPGASSISDSSQPAEPRPLPVNSVKTRATGTTPGKSSKIRDEHKPKDIERTIDVAHRVNVLATEPDDPSSIPRFHIMEEEH